MIKRLYNLDINETLAKVAPPLKNKELEILTESILAEGCNDPLKVWPKGEKLFLLDGKYRYAICREYGIPFAIEEMNIDTMTEAIAWIIRQNLGRRNLTPFQRCEMVLPYEAELKAEAKKRQGRRTDLYGVGDQAAGIGRTCDILAEMAGVSHGNLSKVKAILSMADSETLRRVREGEISIHFAYSTLLAKVELPREPVKHGWNAEIVPISSEMKQDLKPISDAIRNLISRVSVGDATMKMIIAELTRVAVMLDEAR